MNFNRFLKTIFLTEFFLAIIKAIREIFRPKKTINYPLKKVKSAQDTEESMLYEDIQMEKRGA